MQETRGEGYTVLKDCEVELASKGDLKLPMRLRRLHVQRDALKDGKPQVIVVITNDMTRSAVEVAALYKARWAIELLFRWIKQHLMIRKFLGENENAVRLQLIAAMIAFVLLRIAAHRHDIELAHLRFSELAGRFLFERRPIEQTRTAAAQISGRAAAHIAEAAGTRLCLIFPGQPCTSGRREAFLSKMLLYGFLVAFALAHAARSMGITSSMRSATM